MTKEFSRRDFMISAGKVLGTGMLVPLANMIAPISVRAEEAAPQTSWTQEWAGREWGFVVDTPKCIGCARCVVACKKENSVPMDEPVFRTWVERYREEPGGNVKIDSPNGGLDFAKEPGTYDKQFFVPKLCNQCKKPPCVQVCPVGATYRTGDGVILVDRKRCIGCGYCVQSCPYSARFIHPVLHVADKCTWCYHRINQGLPPACVEVCPTKARNFANLKKTGNEVSKILKETETRVLKPDMGTEPNVLYVDLREVVK